MPDILAVIAIVLAAAALALATGSILATRWFLQRLTAELSQPPQFTRKLTPQEERKLREDFHSAMRDRRRTR